MFVALDSKNRRILGYEATKGERYRCQQCHQEVVLKKGQIKAHHFAHYPNAQPCEWWEPETPLHLSMKKHIMELLIHDNDIFSAEFEYKLNLNGDLLFPDIYIKLKSGKEVAVECQASNKPLQDFIEKTQQYSDNDIYTLWIFPWENLNLNYDGDCILTSIQRQSHTWNFGRIYLYNWNLCDDCPMIISAHFRGVFKKAVKLNKKAADFSPTGTFYYHGYKRKFDRYFDFGDSFKVDMDWRPKTPKEFSLRRVNKMTLLCMENDGFEIARFYDKKWWKKK